MGYFPSKLVQDISHQQEDYLQFVIFVEVGTCLGFNSTR